MRTDILIVGSGMVGLSLAWQILETLPSTSVTLLEKEPVTGRHGSGRNSGVLHAGIYYPPDSLKAKVCVRGARRLRAWCDDEKLTVLSCGKVVTPQRPELDSQLDILLDRGRLNGANVELIDQQQFDELAPYGRTSSGRALWSSDTCVVKPISVINRLRERLSQRGVVIRTSEDRWQKSNNKNEIILSDQTKISYAHLFNCAGLHADQIAHRFGVGDQYTMLPFRGAYYQIKKDAPFNISTNLYPVPDLEVPFLGVHATPSVEGNVYLGPTATLAMGRENYQGFRSIEPIESAKFIGHMLRQVTKDERMRRYVKEQAFDWMPHRFLMAAKAIIPRLEMCHIERSEKVGIRPQLYDREKNELVQDFVMLNGPDSTHVVNAISPAFTASFELADHILSKSTFN
jgi:L-2-hydroxyglutarate oxidase